MPAAATDDTWLQHVALVQCISFAAHSGQLASLLQ
jgi:hypothetical protein